MEIRDDNLKPYFIKKTDSNYDVIEDTGKTNAKGEVITKCHGHFSSVEGGLKKIVKLKVEQDEKVYTVKQYINELEEAKKIILND